MPEFVLPPRLVAALLLSLPAGAATAQRGGDPERSAPVSNVRYDVTADRAALAARRLHVVTTLDAQGTGALLLSLPAWTPGAYEISDFAKWVSGFEASEGGAPLRWDKLDYDTWRVRPTGAGRVTIAFDYQADTLDNAMAWTKPDFALFNGTNLFLYPEGRSLEFPSTLTIHTDPEFSIATSMLWSGSRGVYHAPTYHELVDMPVFVGRMDLDSATVSGRTVRYATYPRGSVSGTTRLTAWDQIKRVIPVEVQVFGEAPWPSYTVMQIADSSYQGASGLEHAGSHVDVLTPQAIGSEFQPSLYAHEIFHAWNVKRLRPADLVPYRYDRPQPTAWLWASEGITDYYADLAQVRAGLVDASAFYALTAGKIAEIDATAPFALEDASLNTWIHPKDGTAYSYYPKGSLAGLMLDIAIRDASDNAHSLDGVLRELYETTFKRGRGFTSDDWWGAVRRAAGGRSFDDFARRFVDGRDPYPWDDVLPKVGLRMVRDSAARLGVQTAPGANGAVTVTEVSVGGAAARAGVRVGDVMVRVGSIDVADQQFGAKFRAAYAGQAGGTPLPIIVRRGDQTLTLSGSIIYAPSAPRIVEDPLASAKAVRLRNGILRGSTGR